MATAFEQHSNNGEQTNDKLRNKNKFNVHTPLSTPLIHIFMK
jgi:hypothetical protein